MRRRERQIANERFLLVRVGATLQIVDQSSGVGVGGVESLWINPSGSSVLFGSLTTVNNLRQCIVMRTSLTYETASHPRSEELSLQQD